MRLRVLVHAVVVAAVLGFGVVAHAQSELSGPTVGLDRYELSPGDRVALTITGFRADVVNMSFCGNEGRRGSSDCNVRGTQARETEDGGAPTQAQMTVVAPPAPCPCIIRVASQDNLEVAVAPITLVGHPVADVVGGSEFTTSLSVDIAATPAAAGPSRSIRASLGGGREYDITVVVRNVATFPINDVGVAATFTRESYSDTRSIEIPDPGPMAPGETWEQTVRAAVPSLTFGEVTWSATVSGQGPTVTAHDTTSSRPVLLYLAAVVLVVDLAILLWRLARRLNVRRRRPDADDSEADDEASPDRPPDWDGTAAGDTHRLPELVG